VNLTKVKKDAQEQNIAAGFVLNFGRGRYGGMIAGMKNDFLQGNDCYTKTLTAAFSLLTNQKQTNPQQTNKTPKDRVSFPNTDEHEQDGKASNIALTTNAEQKKTCKEKNFDNSKVTCHRCGEEGHYAPGCHQKRQTGKNRLMSGVANGKFDDGSHISFQFQQQSFEMNEDA
jgi:hypothetical protein